MAYRTLHELVEMLIDTCREDPFIEVYVQMIPKGGDVDDFLEEVVLTITDRTWADITNNIVSKLLNSVYEVIMIKLLSLFSGIGAFESALCRGGV